MKRILWAFLLCLCMALFLAPLSAAAEEINACYIDTNRNGSYDTGEIKYADVSGALEYAGTDETTIRLLRNTTENITVANGQTITLDLGGFVLSGDGTSCVIINYGTLTVDDNYSGDVTHKFTSDANGLWTLDEASGANTVTGGCITHGTGIESEGYSYGGGINNMNNLTIKGGNVVGNTASYGGGIYNCGVCVKIDGGNVSRNKAIWGGGIFNNYYSADYSGAFTLLSGNVSRNVAYYGAGIYNFGSDAQINGGSVFANSTSGIAETYGGGIYNYGGTLTTDGGDISRNTASYGGGIFIYGATALLNGGYIKNNAADENGGGVNNNSGDVTVNGTEILQNSANNGGGIYNIGALTVIGGKISNNSANYYGGGVLYCVGCTMTVGGSAVIYGNKVGGTASNVHLQNYEGNAYLTVSTETPFTGGAVIGCTTYEQTQLTVNGTADDAKYFSSDDKTYSVAFHDGATDDYIELVSTPTVISGAEYYAALTLNENIEIDFDIEKIGTDTQGADFEEENIKIFVNGKTVEFTYNEENNTVSCALKSFAPSELSGELHCAVVYNGIAVKSFTYSVRDYCEAVFTSYESGYGENSDLGKLCKAVLNYGKWAEDYHNEVSNTKAEESVLNEYCVIDFDTVSVSAPTTSVILGTTVTAASARLILDSQVNMVFSVKTDGTVLTKSNIKIMNNDSTEPLPVDSANIDVQPIFGSADYNYTVTIKNIGASKLVRSYTLTVDGDNTFVLTYGVYNYLEEAQTATSEDFTATLKKLCKALYNYGEAAKTFNAGLTE